MTPRTIELRNVVFGYLPGVPVLSGVDVRIEAGLTLLLGPNGSGKSTLLKLAAGVERPDAGSVEVNAHDLWTEEVEARRDLAYLPEAPDLTPYASLLEVMRLVCRLRDVPDERALRALDEAGLPGLETRSVRQLSKGQRRRALVAAAWIGSPHTLVLDEPLDGMDRAMQSRMLEWLDEVRADGGIVFLATHEIEPFVDIADRAIGMSAGEIHLVDSLPHDRHKRLAVVDGLARYGK